VARDGVLLAHATAIEFQPIAVIRTPFTQPEGIPIQPAGAIGVKGTVEVFEEYRPGLKDLEGFSHIWTSSPTFRNLTLQWTYEPVGSRKPSHSFQAGNRTLDSSDAAKMPIRATR
jgi:tRNA (Thr-GGU) A37 N-methylase